MEANVEGRMMNAEWDAEGGTWKAERLGKAKAESVRGCIRPESNPRLTPIARLG